MIIDDLQVALDDLPDHIRMALVEWAKEVRRLAESSTKEPTVSLSIQLDSKTLSELASWLSKLLGVYVSLQSQEGPGSGGSEAGTTPAGAADRG